ncbi:MAG: NAD+ synthase [Candidatus Heimdallarchaeota archaeon]
MTLDESSFEIDCEDICSKVEQFIQDYISQSKTKGVVVGISGGIDSAVATALTVRAIGKEKVMGFILPSAKLDQSYEDDARKLVKQLGIKVKKISIADLVEAFTKNLDDKIAQNRLAVGNAMARFRMVLLYGYANHKNYLVLGTSNKTEIMVGYFTKYGDGGADFEPFGGLYKTHIRLLAKYLDIPEEIITKPPSAGLWKGQTDEGELGITFELLDKILLGLLERDYTKEQIMEKLEIDSATVEKVQKMITKTEHKRNMPPVLEFEKF